MLNSKRQWRIILCCPLPIPTAVPLFCSQAWPLTSIKHSMSTGINKASYYNCYNTFKHKTSLKGALQTDDLHVTTTRGFYTDAEITEIQWGPNVWMNPSVHDLLCFLLHPIPVFGTIRLLDVILPAISHHVTVFYQSFSTKHAVSEVYISAKDT